MSDGAQRIYKISAKNFDIPLHSGLAHVGLHDAVLDGNVDLVKTTLVRYIRQHPERINEEDVRQRLLGK